MLKSFLIRKSKYDESSSKSLDLSETDVMWSPSFTADGTIFRETYVELILHWLLQSLHLEILMGQKISKETNKVTANECCCWRRYCGSILKIFRLWKIYKSGFHMSGFPARITWGNESFPEKSQVSLNACKFAKCQNIQAFNFQGFQIETKRW